MLLDCMDRSKYCYLWRHVMSRDVTCLTRTWAPTLKLATSRGPRVHENPRKSQTLRLNKPLLQKDAAVPSVAAELHCQEDGACPVESPASSCRNSHRANLHGRSQPVTSIMTCSQSPKKHGVDVMASPWLHRSPSCFLSTLAGRTKSPCPGRAVK